MAEIRKIYIAGGAGVGKTRLSNKLAQATGFPVFELDWILWTTGDNGERLQLADRVEITREIAAKSEWIADGMYIGWAQELWKSADLVIFLDISLKLMLWRIFWRHVGAELRRNNRHPGWLKLFRFMKVVVRSYRSTEVGNIDDDSDQGLTQAKIVAKVRQQSHKVMTIGAKPDITEILGLINSK
jgi:adenylate kinase family enzyme